MKLTHLLLAAATALLTACDDSSTIGNSLADEDLTIVVDSAFTLTATTVENPAVQSRTTSQLIGILNAPGFGSISSEFVAQYMPSLNLDTASLTEENIDSIKIFLQMVRGSFTGDSLVPMGIEVHRLIKDLEYPIYSNTPLDGYYDPEVLTSAIYTASTVDEPDSIKAQSTIVVSMPLPVQIGRDLYKAYRANPAVFAAPDQFTKQVFKGLYFRTSYGSGRITDFAANSLRMYYHRQVYNTDSARYEQVNLVGDYFATTPEVIVSNSIDFKVAQSLKDMVASGSQIIAAPAGMEVDIRFPAPEIIDSYNRYASQTRILNTLTFTLPADSIANDFQIGPPPYVLMVLKNQKDEFFANNTLTDNETSFYAAYDATNHCYTFSSMRAYILKLLEKSAITEADYTFTLCPVQVNTESSSSSSSSYYSYYYGYGTTSVVSTIVPYVSKPVMTVIDPGKAKIKLTFSAQNDKIL